MGVRIQTPPADPRWFSTSAPYPPQRRRRRRRPPPHRRARPQSPPPAAPRPAVRSAPPFDPPIDLNNIRRHSLTGNTAMTLDIFFGVKSFPIIVRLIFKILENMQFFCRFRDNSVVHTNFPFFLIPANDLPSTPREGVAGVARPVGAEIPRTTLSSEPRSLGAPSQICLRGKRTLAATGEEGGYQPAG